VPPHTPHRSNVRRARGAMGCRPARTPYGSGAAVRRRNPSIQTRGRRRPRVNGSTTGPAGFERLSRPGVQLEPAHTGRITVTRTPGKSRPIRTSLALSDGLSYNPQWINGHEAAQGDDCWVRADRHDRPDRRRCQAGARPRRRRRHEDMPSVPDWPSAWPSCGKATC
jgi:hypothetical protein